MKFMFLIILLSFNLSAKECEFVINKKDINLTWTAYKTPLKAGVSGSFDKLGVAKKYQKKSLKELLESLTFSIESASVNTKNPERDKKIATSFFKPLGEKISGKAKSYAKKVLTFELNFNGVKKIVPLKVKTSKNTLTASGVIDILDFSGEAALAAINKSCLELHEGKTWSDVALKLEAKYSKSCQ